MDLDDSYYNWVQQFDLTCASSTKMGMIGSTYFIGWITSLTFLPRISDIHGRKNILLWGQIIQALAFATILFASSYALLISAMFVLGMMATMRTQVAFLNMYENSQKDHYDIIVAVAFSFEGAIAMTCAIYFAFISKHWLYLVIFGFSLQFCGLILYFFNVESPRWLIKSG